MTLFHFVAPLFENPSHTFFRTGLSNVAIKNFFFIVLVLFHTSSSVWISALPAECLQREQGVYGSLLSCVGHIESIKKYF